MKFQPLDYARESRKQLRLQRPGKQVLRNTGFGKAGEHGHRSQLVTQQVITRVGESCRESNPWSDPLVLHGGALSARKSSLGRGKIEYTWPRHRVFEEPSIAANIVTTARTLDQYLHGNDQRASTTTLQIPLCVMTPDRQGNAALASFYTRDTYCRIVGECACLAKALPSSSKL